MENAGGGGRRLTLMGQGGMAKETFCLATGIIIEQFDPHLHADAKPRGRSAAADTNDGVRAGGKGELRTWGRLP